jgi:hypothetical protein
VDHCIHPAEAVHVACDVARLLHVCEVADDDVGAALDEVADDFEPVVVANMDDDLMSVGEERLRRRASEAVGRAGDEDAPQRSIIRWFASE